MTGTQLSNTILIGFIVLFGLVIGSFLNVVIHRVPAGKSLLPSSRCPGCDAAIRPWQNVPVLSWLLLRGKCASCGMRISARYPLVELGTGLAFGAVAWWWLRNGGTVGLGTATDGRIDDPAASLMLGGYLFLAATSIALALIDLDTMRLPNAIVYPLIGVFVVIAGAATLLGANPAALSRALIAGGSLTLFYGLLWFFWPGGMGFGDVKLAAVLGFALGWIGWGAFAVGAFAAFAFGGVFGIGLLLARRSGKGTRIPFGPWMLLGAWFGLFVGEAVANWYLGLVLG